MEEDDFDTDFEDTYEEVELTEEEKQRQLEEKMTPEEKHQL